jgi:hypothetical protein
MNTRSLVVIGLRLTALNFFLDGALAVAPFAMSISSAQRADPYPWLAFISLFILAAVIWMGADSFAALITNGLPDQISLGQLSLADCYSVAFILVGLFYVAGHSPGILNWGIYLIRSGASGSETAWKNQTTFYSIAQSTLPFFVGLAFILKGRRWGIVLADRQNKVEMVSSSTPAEPEEQG